MNEQTDTVRLTDRQTDGQTYRQFLISVLCKYYVLDPKAEFDDKLFCLFFHCAIHYILYHCVLFEI